MRKLLSYSFLTTVATVACFILTAHPASAAKLFLESAGQCEEIGVGENIHLELFLDSRGQDVNAIKGKIFFPSDIISLERISQKNSILNYWMDSPEEKDAGEIIFSGIIPGGFNESKGLILSFYFLAQKEGLAQVNVGDMQVLLNDGKGTELETISSGVELLITSGEGCQTEDAQELGVVIPTDSIIPEIFTPIISQYKELFDGQWFISLNAQDADYGISHYEIIESDRPIDFEQVSEEDLDWVNTENLYVLRDQDLQSYVYVKAVDKAGNERIVSVSPKKKEKFPHYTYVKNFAIIISTLLIIFIFIYKYRLPFKKK